MGIRHGAAKAAGTVSTWGLKHVFHRPAANFPGKVGLYADPQLIAHERGKLSRGSIVVVGTNGKTTVTNLLADTLEQAGCTVVCNRTGANLDSGIATALLHAGRADWGVFESDELWLAKSLPQLQARYVVLLNLFRDQLDRCGEIDRIQDAIVGALGRSPESVLVYNADDPLCAAIADRAPNRCVSFGVARSMGLAQNSVSDATMCQRCSTMFRYEFRQYGQLGEYVCPNCGFSRPPLDYAAVDVALGAVGLSFSVEERGEDGASSASVAAEPLSAPFSGAYMVYNLLAVAVAAHLAGASAADVQRAVDAFDPKNGRLQEFTVGGRRVLLNLAKNPTGFNQNLKIVAGDPNPKVVGLFINDKEADGHDVSWLWDIDFEELAHSGSLSVFAGGLRGRDMQVRLKYADIPSRVVETPESMLEALAAFPTSVNAYLIANYTALPACKAALERAQEEAGAKGAEVGRAGASAFPDGAMGPCSTEPSGHAGETASDGGETHPGEVPPSDALPLVIFHMLPDLLNLYGDGGNVRILERRLAWRGIPVEVRRIMHGDPASFDEADLVVMGGSPDREQELASADVRAMADDLRSYVEAGGPLLAICGSYQMLGHEWLLDGQQVPGLGILDASTRRPGTSADRLTNNIALCVPAIDEPVIGYENHAGRTYLGEGVRPFGSVIGSVGCGNSEQSKSDGVRYKNVVGTYLHGPLLAKNPQVADDLLKLALERHARRTGCDLGTLAPLDDSQELDANRALAQRLGVKGQR